MEKDPFIEIDHEKCKICGMCIRACAADALAEEDKKIMMRPPGINECMACGDCVAICPENAITQVKGYEYTGYYKTIDRGDMLLPRLWG